MSEYPITDLYIKNEDGTEFEKIEPKTIAEAVDDETSDRTVQKFIDDGLTDWAEIKGGKEYVTAALIRETFNDIENTVDILDKNSLRYMNTWDATNQIDFSSIELPVKKGYTYKVIGEETEFGNRVYKPGDIIIINRDISKEETINTEDVELLIGYGNEGTKIYRYVADTVQTYDDLLNYENPIENTVIIVANDETHNNNLSFYEYNKLISDYEVQTYADLLNLQMELDVPGYDFTLDEISQVITLNEYIGDLVDVNVPYIVPGHDYQIVKVLSDETHDNKITYYEYNRENKEWIYLNVSALSWSYMFSKEIVSGEGVYKVKGSVPTYNDLPTEGQEIGDVYNILDTGANYVWTEDGWDKLSETVDLTDYYTKEEVYNKEEVDDLLENIDALPPQSGHEGETLYTNGSSAYWKEIPPAVIIYKW